MDAKITLSFNASVIKRAKEYANGHGLSLSRLTEILLKKVINTGQHHNIEDIPVSEWVNAVSEGNAEYQTHRRSRKAMKSDFFESRQ